jgi:hypothetical protein
MRYSRFGGGMNHSELLRKLQEDQDQFNAAGEQQHGDLMALVQGIRERTLGPSGFFGGASSLLDGMGSTENRRIDRAETQALANSEQDLVTRGLGNTTIRESARRGVRSDAEDARQALAERVAGMRSGLMERMAGFDMGLGQLEADSLLSRQFLPPDMGAFANLLQGAGRGAGGRTNMVMPSMGDSGASGQTGGGFGKGGLGGGGGGGGVATFTNPAARRLSNVQAAEEVIQTGRPQENRSGGGGGARCGYIKRPGCRLPNGQIWNP